MAIAFPFSEAIEAEAEQLASRLRDSVVEVRTAGGGSGAGIIWRENGLIVTNSHVVPHDRVEVRLADGRTYPAWSIRRDHMNDLASLRIEAGLVPAAPAGDSRSLRVGQLLFAIGHPLGVRGAVSSGIFSASLRAPNGRELLQAAMQLRPGNSGGPLFDAAGRVVGVNSMVTGPRVALAVPSHVVARFLAQTGEGPRLGVGGRLVPLPASISGGAGQPQWGLVVSDVRPETAADVAGIQIGDVILAVDGRPLSPSGDEFIDLATRLRSSGVDIEVLRGGQRRHMLVRPVHA